MSFDWADYIQLAERIVQDPMRYELIGATHRTAMSRAYYGAFHLASAYSRFPLSGQGIDHSKLREHLESRKPRVARDMKQLYELRREADYENDLTGNAAAMAAQAVEYARRIVAALAS